MTRRKPPALSYQTWVDQQVREAETRGSFDNLPGKGRPIEGIDRPQNELDWIAAMLRRENVDASLLLPPSLQLKKEMQDLRATLAAERSEVRVRELVLDLNQRIREAHRRPQEGPPLTVMSVDVEQTVARWREDRAALAEHLERERAAREAATATAAAATSAPSGRAWRGRLGRRRAGRRSGG